MKCRKGLEYGRKHEFVLVQALFNYFNYDTKKHFAAEQAHAEMEEFKNELNKYGIERGDTIMEALKKLSVFENNQMSAEVRTRACRRARRKAKQFDYKRDPKIKPKKVGHEPN